jgi:Holliday junction DNA helicase RuvA
LRILGIDPGLRLTGFGVIETESSRLLYVASGCVKSGAGDLAARLKCILDGLKDVIAAHDPVEVAVEKVFVSANPQSTLALGQARGTAICAAVLAGLPVAEYTALQVKQSVVATDMPRGAGATRWYACLAGNDPARHGRRLACAITMRAKEPRCNLPGFPTGRGVSFDHRLSGRLAPQPPQVLVDVGGVAYELDVPMSTFYNLPATGEPVSLYTHLVVREDAHTIYGFATLEERTAFRQLIRISGVGARTALAVLSGLSVGELARAVSLQEAAPLTRVPGIGKKTAERLLLELKGKLAEPAAAAGGQQASDVVNALVALGYSDKEALAAAKGLAPGIPVAEAIRAALKTLAKP